MSTSCAGIRPCYLKGTSLLPSTIWRRFLLLRLVVFLYTRDPYTGERPLHWRETLTLERDPYTGERPLHWRETLTLERDPYTGERPLHWRETLTLERDPYTGERPLHWRETLTLERDPYTGERPKQNRCQPYIPSSG